ncbi:hypothetical protein R5W23_003819 [Gemmata sp. JC673]|uniref:HEAT repeat domain-containing protein n=1 Tax=Gemmata algarum TaxID=2975278 RepID=A0ABU5F463_9BACT|nr:hypothetical protein [Gemmata algarum]MDY3562353.1 hypothetical protein [Gemmata algarum]
MPRLTLRTLLAYLDDTLAPVEAKSLGRKVAGSDEARELVDRIKRVTRRRGLKTPVPADADDETADPNTVAEYLDNTLDPATVKQVEETCLGSDVHLAEVAAVHQILTLVLTEPVRVPPRANRRMYGLVESPASRPKRRPNKKLLPVSGTRPPELDRPEADDADAALLLGLKRYAASDSWAGRLALVGIGAALALILVCAVYMSLPHRGPNPPETSPGNSFAQLTPTPVPPPEGSVPKPKEVEPKPKEAEPKPTKKTTDEEPVVPAPKALDPTELSAALGAAVAGEAVAAGAAEPRPNLSDPIAPPDDKVAEIGRVETSRVLVVAQDPGAAGQWVRLKAKPEDDDPVLANVPVMALPGYKAHLLVGPRDKQVQVLLWGNVPEQVPYRVFESRVKFHQPPTGFDADLTLLGGRIYLKSKVTGADKKPAGAKVRVRVAREVWDITIPNAQADVLVELVSWFEPGTMYARKEGPAPRQEARVAVVAGTASLTAPRRFKTVPKLERKTQVDWNSGSGALSDPKPIASDLEADPNPPLDGEVLKIITRTLSDAATKVTDKNVVRQVVEGRLEPPPGTPDRDLVARLAVYTQAALADCTPAGGEHLKPLVDLLRSELPWLARQSAVTALTAWVARDPGNTAILRSVLVNKGLGEETDNEDAADRLLRLLRGFVSPTKPDPDRLDDLVKFLGDKEIPVREAALWNVLAVELETWVPLPLERGNVNVGAVGAAVNSEEYKKFLASWRTKVDALKKRPAPVPLPRPK